VLKGPAGSGKSTCVALLSITLNFQALQWSNPTVSDANMTSSVASQFDDFVNRSGNFGSLDFGASNLNSSDAQIDGQSETSSRVLVVEEFPTNMTRSSSALEAFRGVLLRYLAMSPSASNPMFRKGATSLETHPPIVLIISESLLTSATASADSFTAHRLLGPEIINHPLVSVMEFNTVAPTFVGKALDLVIKKEARDSQRRRIPGPTILKKLSEMGDIRSAVNALEFLCARSADNDDWSGTVATKMKKASKDGVALTAMEKNSLELVTQREATLGMFHAVGKVVYNKREDPQIAEPKAEPPPKPPDHLAHMHKPKIPQMSIDDLMNETGTDIPTFVSTLHENYVLSCNGSSFLESCDNCIGALSDSDILSPEGRSMSRVSYGRGSAGYGLSHAGGIDMLRQNEISFHVAVRGLLIALPHPVNRAAYPGGRKGDTFKMFYPASLRLWKPMEETDSLISKLMEESMFAGVRGAIRGKSPGSGVASWKQKNTAFGTTPEDEESLSIPRILASKTDMLYDRLPYLSKFHVSQELDMRKVKQVTQFRGTDLYDVDDSEEGGVDAAIDLSAADETTDRGRTSPKKGDRKVRIGPDRGSGHGAALATRTNNDFELEKLYISDDDIQDD
jgi:cell cycle checkpoint protein